MEFGDGGFDAFERKVDQFEEDQKTRLCPRCNLQYPEVEVTCFRCVGMSLEEARALGIKHKMEQQDDADIIGKVFLGITVVAIAVFAWFFFK